VKHLGHCRLHTAAFSSCENNNFKRHRMAARLSLKLACLKNTSA
jgi:hypothetical protein